MTIKITSTFLEQLEDLIQYVWENEESHWEESGRPNKHIFITIKNLNDWLADVSRDDAK